MLVRLATVAVFLRVVAPSVPGADTAPGRRPDAVQVLSEAPKELSQRTPIGTVVAAPAPRLVPGREGAIGANAVPVPEPERMALDLLDQLAEKIVRGESIAAAARERAQAAFVSFGESLLRRHHTESLAELGLEDMAAHYVAAWRMSLIDPARHGGWPYRHPGMKAAYPQIRRLLERESRLIRRAGLVIPAVENGEVDRGFELMTSLLESDPAAGDAVLQAMHAWARANGRWDRHANNYGSSGPQYSPSAVTFLNRVDAWQREGAARELNAGVAFLDRTALRALTSRDLSGPERERARELSTKCRTLAEKALVAAEAVDPVLYQCGVMLAMIDADHHGQFPYRFPKRRAVFGALEQRLRVDDTPILKAVMVIPAIENGRAELARTLLAEVAKQSPPVAAWIRRLVSEYARYSNDAAELQRELTGGTPAPGKSATASGSAP